MLCTAETFRAVGTLKEKIRKDIKTIAIFLSFEYSISNRVARSLLDIGDQAEICSQLFYLNIFCDKNNRGRYLNNLPDGSC